MSREISDGKTGAADYRAAIYDRQCKEVAVNEYKSMKYLRRMVREYLMN